MLVSVIAAPPGAPQQYVVPSQSRPLPRLDPLDLAIQQEVQQHGRYGLRVWTALNAISRSQRTGGREKQRRLRLHLWHRLKGLLHRGVLFPFGRKCVSSVKVPRERAVSRKRRVCAGSTIGETSQPPGPPSINHLSGRLLGAPSLDPTLSVGAPKTQTAVSPEDLTEAGRSLAQLPRRPKLRCGRIDGKPSYRGMPVRVSGREVFVFGARSGKVIYTVEPGGPAGDPSSVGVLWGVASAREVQAVRNAAAAILGRGKGGVTEAPSTLKAASSRRNGTAPVRPGSRARGRPAKRLTCPC